MKFIKFIILLSSIFFLVSCDALGQAVKPKTWHCYRQTTDGTDKLPKGVTAVTRRGADETYCNTYFAKHLYDNCKLQVHCSLK